MKQRASTARSARVAVRLTREDQRQVEETARTRGYANPSAFIRAAIRNELDGRAELTGTDERMGAGFDRVSRDIFRMGRGQQALYSLLDAFAKAILTCVPEPPPDARPQAVARAKDRYERLIKAAGQAMSGDRARRHAGFGGPWHELTKTVSSGYDRQSLALPGTKVPRGRADSGFSCTMPAAAERQATARQAEKGKARVLTISAAQCG